MPNNKVKEYFKSHDLSESISEFDSSIKPAGLAIKYNTARKQVSYRYSLKIV
ncbi:MAG: hypothetical protein PHI65_07380 [Firmicutes bacterium]|nr:hypothetical protein [Bacillota bacterium]